MDKIETVLKDILEEETKRFSTETKQEKLKRIRELFAQRIDLDKEIDKLRIEINEIEDMEEMNIDLR